MESLSRYQWHVFWSSLAVIGALIVFRLSVLFPIYTNADFRGRVQTLIQATAVREGWLSSGLSIRRITDDSVELLYRSHQRGPDTVRCETLHLATGKLSPCENF